jgi:hypothetical protein
MSDGERFDRRWAEARLPTSYILWGDWTAEERAQLEAGLERARVSLTIELGDVPWVVMKLPGGALTASLSTRLSERVSAATIRGICERIAEWSAAHTSAISVDFASMFAQAASSHAFELGL